MSRAADSLGRFLRTPAKAARLGPRARWQFAALLASVALGACADGEDIVLILPHLPADSASGMAAAGGITAQGGGAGDGSGNPPPGAAGAPASGGSLAVIAGNEGGAGDKDAGTNGGSADVSPCGVAPDTDPAPKVRFINALASRADREAYPPVRLRPLANGEPLVTDAIPPISSVARVSGYVPIEPGDVTFGYELTPVATSADDGVRRIRQALPVAVKPNERYTLLAVGDGIAENFDFGHAVVIKEQRLETSCDRARLQFVWADGSAGPGSTTTLPSFFLAGGTSPVAVASFGAASPPFSIEVPLDAPSLTVTIPDADYLGLTEQAPFSLPPGALRGGRSYLVLTAGTLQALAPDTGYRLVIASADGGEATFTTVYRDPLVTFVHASPPPTPEKLEVYSGNGRVAINLEYPATAAGQVGGITVADLPPSGATLSFVDATEPGRGRPLLADQATGELSPGAFYVMVLEGLTALSDAGSDPGRLQTRLYRIEPIENDFLVQKHATQVVFLHASATAPALDLGYFTDGSALAASFVAVQESIGYGASTELGGIDLRVPQVTLPDGRFSFFAALRESGTAIARGWQATTAIDSRLLVLTGDWQATDGAAAARLIEIGSFPWRTSVSPRGGKPWSWP